MRVLVVDQDHSLLTAITQSLGEYFSIDAVTTKADCLDLVRVNEFEVIVAGERLVDGSGLELLGQLVKHRPNMLRIFAAERERLKLLKGRLAPFGLFRTLAYPIEIRQLLAALSAAGGAHTQPEDEANDPLVDFTSEAAENEAPAEEPVSPVVAQRRSGPTPYRPALGQSRAAQTPLGTAARQAVPAAPPVRKSPPRTNATPPRQQTAQHSGRTPARKVRSAQPSQSSQAESGRRPAPRTSGGSGSRTPTTGNSLSEVSQIAAARLRQPETLEASSTKRSAFLVGAGVVVVLGALGIALKLNSAHDESPASSRSAPATRTAHFAPEVVRLVADTEAAFQQDDFKRARRNLGTLQQIAPDHPRLPFFESLLARGGTAAAGESAQTATAAKPQPHDAPAAASAASAHDLKFHNTTSPAKLARQPAATAGNQAATPPAAAPTATTSASGTAPTTFNGRTLEESGGKSGSSSQPVTPSATLATAVPRLDTSPADTREPRLVKHVPAVYPPSAASRGIEGVVEVSFTVLKDGSVGDVQVVHAEPAGTFDHSATAAVSHWKYEPKTVNGAPVEARMQLRLQFKMDQAEP